MNLKIELQIELRTKNYCRYKKARFEEIMAIQFEHCIHVSGHT